LKKKASRTSTEKRRTSISPSNWTRAAWKSLITSRCAYTSVTMKKEKPVEKDKLAPYNTGVETVVAGAIVLVIGILFQSLGGNIASRITGTTDLSYLMQHIAWIFWMAPICYVISAPILGVGAFLLYRAYRRTHPRDKQQTRLTSYRI